MVRKGEFIDFAVGLKDTEGLDTYMQCITELSVKIKELEARIAELEEK